MQLFTCVVTLIATAVVFVAGNPVQSSISDSEVAAAGNLNVNVHHEAESDMGNVRPMPGPTTALSRWRKAAYGGGDRIPFAPADSGCPKNLIFSCEPTYKSVPCAENYQQPQQHQQPQQYVGSPLVAQSAPVPTFIAASQGAGAYGLPQTWTDKEYMPHGIHYRNHQFYGF